MSYDYLIVGAGSAGATLAARLTEAPDISVLLLEAGPDYPARNDRPADIVDSRNLAGLAHDWNYVASPVPGRSIPYRRGRVTGGTSAINAAAALWGRREDFDRWVALGNTEWSWDRVEPWFRKLEADNGGAGDSHGTDGPIEIQRYGDGDLIPVQRAFAQACVELGFTPTADHNDQTPGGVGPWPMNRKGIERQSTAVAYLDAARGRRNLTILPEAVVDRVRFDGARAIGVDLAGPRAGQSEYAANVVLCAGAIGSAAILMRSGIGGGGMLARLGIDVRADRKGVGDQLWDHAAVPVRLLPKPGQCVPGHDPRFQMMAKFTSSGSADVDDLQLVMVSHQDISPFPALVEQLGTPVVAMVLAALMLPRGHGRVTLTSAEPNSAPQIELRFAHEREDLSRLMEATRLAWRVAGSAQMSEATRGIAGIDARIVESDELLARYVRDNVVTYCHALGTARMGPVQDPEAVVDQHCSVHGVERLLVIDASVMPAVPRVVPNLSVIMLAERMAAKLRSGAW